MAFLVISLIISSWLVNLGMSFQEPKEVAVNRLQRALSWGLTIFAGVTSVAHAQDIQVDAYGYAEGTSMVFVTEDDPWLYAHGRFRPTFEAAFGDRLVLSSSFSITARHHSSQDFFWMDCSPNQTCFMPSRFGHDNLLFEFERLFVDYYGEQIDVRVGRQALFWGSGLIWNPSNPFQQVLAFSPWENRSGIDALRVNWALPWELDSSWIASLDEDGIPSKGVARLQKQFSDLDVALVGAMSGQEDKEAAYAGFDLKGNLGVTYWIEGAIHFHPELYTEVVIGADYSFDILDTWVLAAQYNYNDVKNLERMELRQKDPFSPLSTDTHSLVISSGLRFFEDWNMQNLLYASLDNQAGATMNTLSWAGADSFSAQVAWIQPFSFGEQDEASLPGGGTGLSTDTLSAFIMCWGRWSY